MFIEMTIYYPVLEADLANFRLAVSQMPSTLMTYVKPPSDDDVNRVHQVYLQFSDPRDLIGIGIAFCSMALSDRDFVELNTFAHAGD